MNNYNYDNQIGLISYLLQKKIGYILLTGSFRILEEMLLTGSFRILPDKLINLLGFSIIFSLFFGNAFYHLIVI